MQNLPVHPSPICIVECPRDAMQGWPHPISTEQKIHYLNHLLQVGFHTLDFGSFVSAKAIPQMADTHQVLAGLDLSNTYTKLLAIVANLRGAKEAIDSGLIDYIGYPLSISPTFQKLNTNHSIGEGWQMLEEMQALCKAHKKTLVVYLSMGFGNPYGDAYHAQLLAEFSLKLSAMEVSVISIADTVGKAHPDQIRELFDLLIPSFSSIQFGAHLHAAPANWRPLLSAAYQSGCKRFDGAMLGIGGCPMAKNELVGNLSTENMLQFFAEQNEQLFLDADQFEQCKWLAKKIFS